MIKTVTLEQRVENVKRFGAAINRILAEKGINRHELRTRMGANGTNIYRILNGQSSAKTRTLEIMAGALGMRPDVIIGMYNGNIPPAYDPDRVCEPTPPSLHPARTPAEQPTIAERILEQAAKVYDGVQISFDPYSGTAHVKATINHVMPMAAALDLAKIITLLVQRKEQENAG